VVDDPGECRDSIDDASLRGNTVMTMQIREHQMSVADIGEMEDPGRWHTAFLLLGMDAATPFWTDMGLDLEPDPALQRISRQFVKDYRGFENDRSLNDEQRQDAIRDLLSRTFRRLNETGDEAAAIAVYRWVSQVFPYEPANDPASFIWRFLLRRLAGAGGGYPQVPIPLPDDRRQEVQRIARHHLDQSQALQGRLQSARNARPSEWDDVIRRTYTPGASPFDWIEETIETVNTKAAWRDIQASLQPQEIESLRDWGLAQAHAMEIPIDSLTFPQPMTPRDEDA
jgi:hypothetical protein